MLEDEIFYLAEKERLYANDADKQLEIQSQLIDKRMEMEEMLSADVDAIMQADLDNMEIYTEEEKKLIDKQLEDAKTLTENLKKEMEQRVKDEKEAQQKRAELVMDLAAQIGQTLGETIADSEKDFRSFGKSIALIALNTLQGMVPVMVAQITGLSLASPESVATAGVAGLAKAALLTAALEAVIAGAKVAVNNKEFKTGGFTSPADSDSRPAGIVHANEWVASAPLLRNPETRRHIDYLENVQRGIYPRFNTASISAATRGFQVGGHTSTPPPISRTDAMPSVSVIQEQNTAMMGAMIGLLNELKQNGVSAKVNAEEVFQKKAQYDSNIHASEL